jgi:hypothetical protein
VLTAQSTAAFEGSTAPNSATLTNPVRAKEAKESAVRMRTGRLTVPRLVLAIGFFRARRDAVQFCSPTPGASA